MAGSRVRLRVLPLSLLPWLGPNGTHLSHRFFLEYARAVANIKSQKKRNRQNLVRHERNLATRSELKTRVKRARIAVDQGADEAADTVRAAQKRLGKAGAKGRIHKNQAARRTSRLMKRQAKTSG
jgi:small subunit ribosomal protein S20